MTEATINHNYFLGSYKESKNHSFPLQSYVCSLYRLHGQWTSNKPEPNSFLGGHLRPKPSIT